MPAFTSGTLPAFLATLPDPRHRCGKRHPLVAMLTAACCAILCGARGYAAIAQWGRLQPIDWMHRLGFRRTPPCQGAYRKLFLQLDLKALEAALAAWAEHLLGARLTDQAWQAVAIDGKVLRGSETPLGGAVHLLAALDHATGCVLAQTAVDPTTNEHKAAFRLLAALVLEGRVITGDAAFCQRDLCQEIVTEGGHYFFKVDDNQPTLKADIDLAFEPGFPPSKAAAQEDYHERCTTVDSHGGALRDGPWRQPTGCGALSTGRAQLRFVVSR